MQLSDIKRTWVKDYDDDPYEVGYFLITGNLKITCFETEFTYPIYLQIDHWMNIKLKDNDVIEQGFQFYYEDPECYYHYPIQQTTAEVKGRKYYINQEGEKEVASKYSYIEFMESGNYRIVLKPSKKSETTRFVGEYIFPKEETPKISVILKEIFFPVQKK